MKLIITGASGKVGTELLRQSLQHPQIHAVVAVARKSLTAPEGTDAKKLRSVVVEDYESYPDDVRREFAGANACIWTVAVTPTRSKLLPFEEVRRVCQTCTMAGLRAIYEAGPAKPFRFLYMSGSATERDQSKVPWFMKEYALMRGETENQILAYAVEHKGDLEACVAKAGLMIPSSGILSLAGKVANLAVGLVGIREAAAAVLDQVLSGFEKEPLLNEDLRRLGAKALGGSSGT